MTWRVAAPGPDRPNDLPSENGEECAWSLQDRDGCGRWVSGERSFSVGFRAPALGMEIQQRRHVTFHCLRIDLKVPPRSIRNIRTVLGADPRLLNHLLWQRRLSRSERKVTLKLSRLRNDNRYLPRFAAKSQALRPEDPQPAGILPFKKVLLHHPTVQLFGRRLLPAKRL